MARGQNFKLLPPPGTGYIVPWVAGRTYTVSFYARTSAYPTSGSESLLVVGLEDETTTYWNPTSPYSLSNFAAAGISAAGNLSLTGTFGTAGSTAFSLDTWHHVELIVRWHSGATTATATLKLDGSTVGTATSNSDGLPGYYVAVFTDALTLPGVGTWAQGGTRYVDFDTLTISDDNTGLLYTAAFDSGGATGTSYYHDDWPDTYLFVPGFSGPALRIGVLSGAGQCWV